jgi:ribonuclease P protein component
MVSALAPNGSANVSGSAPRNQFPRSVRLLRHADFERVYKLGRRHFAPHLTVFYLPRRGKDEGQGEVSEGDCKSKGGSKDTGSAARVGFTVSKVLGGAVVRNRMKRRLREAVRLHGLIPVAVDVVINPKKSLLSADFADVRSEIGRAFEVIASSVTKGSVTKSSVKE